MHSRRSIIVGLALAAANAACAAWAVAPGAPLPPIAAARLDDASARLSLQSLRGNVVYVDFWASWCVPCRQSMPQLDDLYRKYRDRGLRVVGVNKDVAPADAQRFLKRVHVTFPLVSDGDDAVARAFDVQAMPSGYLVDRAGVVRYVHRGFTAETAAELRGEIEALLGDKR
ncbi:MAG TPA: TlpA disulfide reductase family protein [Usitatibacter sp.]|nr:TlpA disulfide reductase family protein [Usitatibacter sp.]